MASHGRGSWVQRRTTFNRPGSRLTGTLPTWRPDSNSSARLTPAGKATTGVRPRTRLTSALSIINDILDISKIDAGRMTTERIWVETQQFLESVLELLGRRAENQGTKLLLNCRGILPAYLITDPTRLRRILMNLLGNAIKFTSEGTVTLCI